MKCGDDLCEDCDCSLGPEIKRDKWEALNDPPTDSKELFDVFLATFSELEEQQLTSNQVLDALLEAYYLYEFPINVIFNGRKKLMALLKNSIEEQKELLGSPFTHSLKRRNMLYLELTGDDILEGGC